MWHQAAKLFGLADPSKSCRPQEQSKNEHVPNRMVSSTGSVKSFGPVCFRHLLHHSISNSLTSTFICVLYALAFDTVIDGRHPRAPLKLHTHYLD